VNRLAATESNTYSPRGYFCLLACIAVLVTSTGAAAQSIYRPLGLNPGDEYRLVFVTEGTRDALSTDIAVYNAFVTDEARASGSIVRGLTADWFAIASTADVDAIENTGTDPSPPGQTSVPIYLVDGQRRFADHYDNLWDGDSFGIVVGAPMLTQYGVAASKIVWTGTDWYGKAHGSRPLGSPNPAFGQSFSPNARWIESGGGGLSADQMRSLYGISSVLVAVPEPSAAALLSASLFAFLSRRRRSRPPYSPSNNQ